MINNGVTYIYLSCEVVMCVCFSLPFMRFSDDVKIDPKPAVHKVRTCTCMYIHTQHTHTHTHTHMHAHTTHTRREGL